MNNSTRLGTVNLRRDAADDRDWLDWTKPNLINPWIMNDFIGDVDLAVREPLPGFVRHLHSALNPPTESVGVSQHNCDVSMSEQITVLSHLRRKRQR